MKTANDDFFEIGRMSVTSVAEPSRKPTPIPMNIAGQMGMPHSPNWYTKYAQNNAISPCAKLRCPVPR